MSCATVSVGNRDTFGKQFLWPAVISVTLFARVHTSTLVLRFKLHIDSAAGCGSGVETIDS